MHSHVFASPAYLKRFGEPKTIADIDEHRIVAFGENAPTYPKDMNWLCSAGRKALELLIRLTAQPCLDRRRVGGGSGTRPGRSRI